MPRLETRCYRVSAMEKESDIPHLSAEKEAFHSKADIDSFEGLFIDYGRRETSYPYTQQNSYKEETEREIPVAILENDELYAEFLPTLGGRLWKLFDKRRERDVLYTNDVIRFRNLSIRNAWFSGGVEWNCGIVGHSPFTCAPMYCAFVQGKNGEDVLRFYEYERVREIYYQMDFWLAGDKLMTAVRIENPNAEVVPMYWWSTMATPEFKGGRVAVPAHSAYNNSDGMGIKKSEIPFDNGVEVSYPENIYDTIDYFYDIPQKEDKFIANVDKDGFGILQFSSNNLKGRKLFSWGHRNGSHHWQKMLTDKAGYYVEIQAGLGKTQYECIPMPPKSVWTFSECYTLADVGAECVTKDYDEFMRAVQAQVLSLGGSAALDTQLETFAEDISLQTGEVVLKGDGFGYLHKALGGKTPKQLAFFENASVEPWLALLRGEEPKERLSFAYGAKMENLLQKHRDICNWNIPYQLALLSYDRRDFETAKRYCEESMLYDNNAYNSHLYTFILYQLDDARYSYFAKRCIEMQNNSYCLAESIMSLLLKAQAYVTVADCFYKLTKPLQRSPRLLMYLSMAYLQSGDAKQAEDVLLRDGGLVILDFREGDKLLQTLYCGIRKALYNENESEVKVPEQFDFIVANIQ